MKAHHIAWILLLTGVAVNIIDAVTDQSGTGAGGVFYGPTGILAGVDSKVSFNIGKLHVNTAGILIAGGGGYLLYHHFVKGR